MKNYKNILYWEKPTLTDFKVRYYPSRVKYEESDNHRNRSPEL